MRYPVLIEEGTENTAARRQSRGAFIADLTMHLHG